MVLGAVRLRTWARPERANGVLRPVTAERGVVRIGPARHDMEARMVAGQVRFLTRARRESARVAEWHGTARKGAVWRASIRHVLGGALDGRRWGSTPHRGTARKRSPRGWDWQSSAGRGVAGHGERYWQTPGFKSPERTTSKEVQESDGNRMYRHGSARSDSARHGGHVPGMTTQGKEHNGGPGVLSPRPPQARQLTHPGGYQ